MALSAENTVRVVEVEENTQGGSGGDTTSFPSPTRLWVLPGDQTVLERRVQSQYARRSKSRAAVDL